MQIARFVLRRRVISAIFVLTIMERASLTRFAWLSIAAALATIVLKMSAYYVTGCVGLLSDALESVVNLVAALMALAMLTVAARPPDEMYAFGYSKAEYFSSGLEGALILLADMVQRSANKTCYKLRRRPLTLKFSCSICRNTERMQRTKAAVTPFSN